MQKLDNYIKEQFKDEDEITEFINASLEQYFEDHNKELFLATLKEVIMVRGGVTEISKHAHINRQHIAIFCTQWGEQYTGQTNP